MGARGRRVLPADRANDPKGCRWCGLRVRYPADHPKAGEPHPRRSWHPECAAEYRLAHFSADWRAVIRRRGDTVCAVCGTVCRTSGGWRDLVAWEADHRRPLYERPAVLTRAEIAEWFGAPNLQLLCGPCHTAKCVRETMTRAAVRRALAEAAP